MAALVSQSQLMYMHSLFAVLLSLNSLCLSPRIPKRPGLRHPLSLVACLVGGDDIGFIAGSSLSLFLHLHLTTINAIPQLCTPGSPTTTHFNLRRVFHNHPLFT